MRNRSKRAFDWAKSGELKLAGPNPARARLDFKRSQLVKKRAKKFFIIKNLNYIRNIINTVTLKKMSLSR